MKNSKKIIVMMIVLVIGLVYIINKPSNNKNVLNNKQEEPKVREKMAIKVENDSGEYIDASSFPEKGYVINNEKTECVDQAGNKVDGVSISSDGTSVTVTSKYTAYCTLYFDKTMSLGQFCKDENMETCISSKKSTIGKVENMTSSKVGGMYRYQGTNDVNNWICFGTTIQSICTSNADKYMYRIIGVTDDGQLALIKETGVKEIDSTNRTFYWNNKYFKTDCGSDGLECTWANSTLYNRLNGLCKSDNINCSGIGSGMSGQTNIFIGNEYYEYLTNESIWLDKISNHTWKYGDTTSNGNYNGDNAYIIENDFTASVPNAKIGLQYIHDYYYAYPGGDPGSRADAKNAWIYLKKNGDSEISYEWLISRYGVYSNYVGAWFVGPTADVRYNMLNDTNGVRPVFYLNSDIKISNTAGSKDDPFMIT